MRVDGYDRPIDLVAAMTIGDDGIDVDFAGTSPAVLAFGINVPLCYTEAYASFGVKCIVRAEGAEQRRARWRCSACHAPESCILNAQASVAGRDAPRHRADAARRGVRLPQRRRSPNEVPAEGTSCLWNLFAYRRLEPDRRRIRRN